MQKHPGFPSRLPGTDYQFTLRRAAKGRPTPLISRKRHADRRREELAADEGFLTALWDYFGTEPFVRGNLDAGRLSWVLGREVVAAEDPFRPDSYDALLRIDAAVLAKTFPNVLEPDA